ncbi:MAG: membrane protein YqaA with SNARE-associated domain [Alphaproteobacteria bacterium]|jgi:membrane protein YqaA with SNARE-associated domain
MSIKKRTKKLINSKHMPWGIGIASFLESTIVPIPLETMLVPVMQKRREKLWLIATVTTLGCMLGALVGYAIGYFIFDMARDLIMQYVTNEEQFTTFKSTMKNQGFWFIFSTGVTPVPLQLAMLAAGLSKYSLFLYMLAVTTSRIVRYFGIAMLVYYFGDKTEQLIRQYKWQAAVIGVIAILLFFSLPFWLGI